MTDTPEEDKFLEQLRNTKVPEECKHEWADLYYGSGTDRKNVNMMWTYFFCKRCLKTKLLKFDQSMMRLNEDFEQEREEKGI